MRVSGLGEVVVCVRAGVLRLQDVVVRGGEREGVGDGVEVHTRSGDDHGFSDFSDGSLSVRGGSEWTREAECGGDEE